MLNDDDGCIALKERVRPFGVKGVAGEDSSNDPAVLSKEVQDKLKTQIMSIKKKRQKEKTEVDLRDFSFGKKKGGECAAATLMHIMTLVCHEVTDHPKVTKGREYEA